MKKFKDNLVVIFILLIVVTLFTIKITHNIDKVSYKHNGTITYNKDLNQIDVKYNKDKVAYLEVPASIKYASKIDLIVNIRGKKYTINLLNMNNNLK